VIVVRKIANGTATATATSLCLNAMRQTAGASEDTQSSLGKKPQLQYTHWKHVISSIRCCPLHCLWQCCRPCVAGFQPVRAYHCGLHATPHRQLSQHWAQKLKATRTPRSAAVASGWTCCDSIAGYETCLENCIACDHATIIGLKIGP
jgi:hypothetical protein